MEGGIVPPPPRKVLVTFARIASPLPWIPWASGFGCLHGALGWAPCPPGASVFSCQLLLSGPQPPSSVRGWGGGPGPLQHGPEAGPSPRADQGVDGKGALHVADSKRGDGGYGEAFSTQDRAEGGGGGGRQSDSRA